MPLARAEATKTLKVEGIPPPIPTWIWLAIGATVATLIILYAVSRK
ncbi:MAG: hypothetical protein QXR62_04660 [Candidatus Bathyarchaeia archaeon]